MNDDQGVKADDLRTMGTGSHIETGAESAPTNVSYLLYLAFAAFLIGRCWIFVDPEVRHSTISLYAKYGFEYAAAAAQHVTVYDVSAADARKRPALPGSRPEPGAGTIEYPPMVISWMALPVRLLHLPEHGWPVSAAELRAYITGARVGFVLFDVFGMGLLWYALRVRFRARSGRLAAAIGSYAACGLCLYALIYDRMDIVMGTLIAAALVTLTSPLPWAVSFVLLAIAIHFKVVAILLAPVWIIGSLPCGVLRSRPVHQCLAVSSRIGILGLAGLAIFLPYFLQCGWQTLEFLNYHTQRGIQFESLLANILLLLRPIGLPVSIEHSYGSTNLQVAGSSAMASLATAAMLCTIAIAVRCLWVDVRKRSEGLPSTTRVGLLFPELFVRHSVLILAIGICGSKVFSPQYLLWFLPLVPQLILADEQADSKLQSVFFGVALFTMLIYPVLFDTDIRPALRDGYSVTYLPPTLRGLVTLTFRNALFLWMTVLLWRPSAERNP